MRRGRGFAASTPQRNKVKGQPCIVCLREPVDPAHVIDRALGGCNDPLCVVPLCRRCHDLYDNGKLDLLPMLEPRFRDEQAHAVGHLGIARAFMRVTNDRQAAA